MQWPDWTYLTRANSPGEDTVKEEWRDALDQLQQRLRELVEVSAKDLVFDGVTDQTAELEAALAAYGGVRVVGPPGGVLRLAGYVDVGSGQVLDLSAVEVDATGGAVRALGARTGSIFDASADWPAGSTVLPVASDPSGTIAPGDVVEVRQDTSVSGEPNSVELAKVVAVTASSVTLNRPLLRSYAAASGAKLEKLLPATGALIVGARQLRGGNYRLELAYESAIVAPVRTGLTSGERMVEVEYSLNCLVAAPVALGQGGTGLHARAATGLVLVQPRFEGLDKGAEVKCCSTSLLLGGMYVGCTTGVDVRGLGSAEIVVQGGLFSGGDVGVRAGSADFAQLDLGIRAIGAQFFDPATAAVELFAPVDDVTLSGAAVTGADAVKLEGSEGGGKVFVPSLVQSRASGAYALRDNATAGFEVHLGVVLQDASVAGLKGGSGNSTVVQSSSGGLPSPGSLPGGVVRSDGTAYYLHSPVLGNAPSYVTLTGDATLTSGQAWLNGGDWAVAPTTLQVDAGASAVALTVDGSAPAGTVWRIVLAPTQTGAVTVNAPGTGTFQNGAPSISVLGEAFVELLPDGNCRAYGETDAGAKLPSNIELGGGILNGGTAEAYNLVPVENVVSVNYTLAADDAGKVLVVDAQGISITVPASWRGRCEVLNISGGSISIDGVGASSVSVADGQSALIAGYGAASRRAVFVLTPTQSG